MNVILIKPEFMTLHNNTLIYVLKHRDTKTFFAQWNNFCNFCIFGYLKYFKTLCLKKYIMCMTLRSRLYWIWQCKSCFEIVTNRKEIVWNNIWIKDLSDYHLLKSKEVSEDIRVLKQHWVKSLTIFIKWIMFA